MTHDTSDTTTGERHYSTWEAALILNLHITRPRLPRRPDTRVTWIASIATAAWLTLLVTYLDHTSSPPLFTAVTGITAVAWIVRFELWRMSKDEQQDERLVDEMHKTNRSNTDDEEFRAITRYLEEWEGEQQ